MVNGGRGSEMGEMTMDDGHSRITFNRDGSVEVTATALCDRCGQFQPANHGKDITDSSGQVIMWFCFKCRLQAYER